MRTITRREYEQATLDGQNPTVVLFGGRTRAGRAAERRLDAVARIFSGAVNFFRLDADDSSGLASHLGITRTPAVVLLRGGRAYWRSLGELSRTALQELKRKLFTVSSAVEETPPTTLPESKKPVPMRRSPQSNLYTPPSPRTSRLPRARAGGKRMTLARLARFNLTLAPATAPRRVFRTEREFELQVIEPHLQVWGCHCATQVSRTVYRGKQKLPGRIDFVVRRPNSRAVLTVIESKREIRSLAQLYHAAYQAESYARALRLRHFVVAAPEGCWIFGRTGRTFHQLEVFGADIWDGRASLLQARIYELVGYCPL